MAGGDAWTIPIVVSRKFLMGYLRSGMEQHRRSGFLTKIYQPVGSERSVLPPLLSRKHTRARTLITAVSSARDGGQEGALARSSPMAINERRKVSTMLHINVLNRPLERDQALTH